MMQCLPAQVDPEVMAKTEALPLLEVELQLQVPATPACPIQSCS